MDNRQFARLSGSLTLLSTSICQPGRPGPQGDSQAGSPGLTAFQRAKSAGCFFPEARDLQTVIYLHFVRRVFHSL